MARERGRRRVLWRLGVAAGVALVVAGAAIGYAGYERTSGPDGAVRAYFSALAAGDAPRALAWGDLPDGPHTLLTSQVLLEQQRIAPLQDLRIGQVTRSGSTATVAVRYALGFARHDVQVSAKVAVLKRGDDWRLRATAVRTQLLLTSASQRARVLHAAVPTGSTLVFPGAVPVSLDTPYLELDPAQDAVGFGTGPLTQVAVQVSSSGRAAILRAVAVRLAGCLRSGADTSCPLPGDRYVPGSVRGSVPAGDLAQLTIAVSSAASGAVSIDGHVPVTGSYQQLLFDNRARTGRGQVELQVHGYVYPVAPLTVVWTDA